MATNIINGFIVDVKTKQPIAGVKIEAWIKDERVKAALGTAESNEKGAFTIELDKRLFIAIILTGKPDVFFRIFYKEKQVADTAGSVAWNVANDTQTITVAINVGSGSTDVPAQTFIVHGKIIDTSGVIIPGIRVVAYDRRLDGDMLLVQGISGKDGSYKLSFSSDTLKGKEQPDIEVRVTDARDTANEFGRSAVTYNAGLDSTIDVVVAAGKAIALTEYELLLRDVQPQLGTMTLKDIDETDGKEQVTLLSNKTGWDARMVAMASQAQKMAATTGVNAAHYYALFRSGIPGDTASVSKLTPQALNDMLKKAADEKVVPAGQIDETIKILSSKNVEYVLNNAPLNAVSTISSMLDLRLSANEKPVFAQALQDAGEDTSRLWSTLQAKQFNPETISKLQLDGKLGYLTGQNAPLMARLYNGMQVNTAADLVTKGLYKAATWKEVIGQDVPKDVALDDYAKHLATQVKLSYPTAVMAEMMNNNEITLPDNTPKDELYKFLYNNNEKFTIGQQPLKSWDGYNALSASSKSAAKTMERLYQLSPSDESMTAMSKLGISSAFHIAHYTRQEFLAKYQQGFPSAAEANLTYTKAAEVQSSVLHVATTYLTYRAAPNLYALTGKLKKEQNETIAYPTLEELFGNMDYCACDDCKSVLSAAAYLVDLLQFIDLDIPHDKSNPIDILLKRRPDIQHIQLSCENTNTILPYIDLVNEILEYYVVNPTIDAFRQRDITEDIQTADLLANPQYVDEAAYTELKTKVYPYGLPFDQPLEALRLLFKAWDTTLKDALDIFSDKLSARKEALGLNAEEFKILTDITAHALPAYFGEPDASTIDALNAAISDGKTFCRRVNISYDELVQLLRTNFINPGISIVPLLQKLQISLTDLQDYYTGVISDGDMDLKIPAGTNPADYNGDVKQWLKDNRQLVMGLVTLTDTGAATTECNFAEVQLRYALPDNANNKLTELSYHKFNRFIRVWKKTGWSIYTTDNVITELLPVFSVNTDITTIDGTFITLLDRLGNFIKLLELLGYSEKKIPVLLQLWDVSKSLDYRQQQLAQILKMRVQDMLDLSAITGLNPLANDLETDEPSLLSYIAVTAQLKRASIKIADLNYILQHKDDTVKLTLSTDTVLSNIKLLRDGLTTVEKENSIAPDNADFAFAKSKMALVYDAAVVDKFFGLLSGGATYSAAFNSIEDALPKKITDADANVGFDTFKKQLTYAGILSATAETNLKNIADTLVLADMDDITLQPDLTTFIADFKTATTQAGLAGNNDLASFAAVYPELKTIYDNVTAQPTPALQTQTLVAQILPELKAKLKAISLSQSLAAVLKADGEIVDTLTSKKEFIQSIADNSKTVLYDFLQLEQPITFDQNQVYNFYIDAPATDEYIVYVTAPLNTTITLNLNGQVIINANIGATGELKNALPVTLEAGRLYKVQLTLAALPVNSKAVISWQTKGMIKAAIPAEKIYVLQSANNAAASLIRLQKAVQLQSLLQLTSSEMKQLFVTNPETKNLLNDLKTNTVITPPQLQAMWKKLSLIIFFVNTRNDSSAEEDDWARVLENPDSLTAQGKKLPESINGWKDQDVTDVLTHFALARIDLQKISVLQKLIPAMNLIATTGYTAADVISWSINNPTVPLIEIIKNKIKDSVTNAAWLDTIQTVNDSLRSMQRDALVNYILYHKKPSAEIDMADKLFEYFLIDVEMGACMKTSRIKQALSTVQLFIQRCLINLEPDVAPSSIRSQQWEWMKRYRVWEANRKVFLYPENWLEPELRDNKSSFFKELEGELMQADINDELAETAFLNYLKKLDDVARLEIAGMYLEENEQGNQDDDILHVIGRTNGNTKQYFYRRFEYGYWTPWEKISLSIEGEHIFPVVWKKRFFIFWLNMIEKEATINTAGMEGKKAGEITAGDAAKPPLKNVEINMCYGEYYKGKWTSPKSSELNKPIKIFSLSAFEKNQILVYARKEKKPNITERLIFNLYYAGPGSSGNSSVYYTITYTSKNAPPILVKEVDTALSQNVALFNYTLFRSPYSDSLLWYNSLFSESKELKLNINQPQNASTSVKTETLFTKTANTYNGVNVLPIRHNTENQWEAPFIYFDEHSTFFVKGDEQVFNSFRRYEGYYTPGIFVNPEINIPPYSTKPVAGWPPDKGILNNYKDIVTNPARWQEEVISSNNNYKNVIADNLNFQFGQTVFGAQGKVNISTKTNNVNR